MKAISQTAMLFAIALGAGISAIGTAHAQWTVTGQNLFGDQNPTNNSGINANVGVLLDNNTESEYLLANGGATEFSTTTSTIHYRGADDGGNGSNAFPAANAGTSPFPTGAGTSGPDANPSNNFVLLATSTVTVVGAPSANVFFYATTDDGFKLELIRGANTTLIFGLDTGNLFDTNQVSPLTNVQTGDILRFVHFERQGGEFAYLYTDVDGNVATTTDRALVTSVAGTGVTFNGGAVVPEAGTVALLLPALGLIATGAIARRRK